MGLYGRVRLVALLGAAVAGACGDGSGGEPLHPDADEGGSGGDVQGGDAGAEGADGAGGTVHGCTLFPQAGCPSGQGCDLDFSTPEGDTVCRNAGAGDEDDACTVAEQCAAGYACLGFVEANAFNCVPFCGSDADCTPAGEVCVQLDAFPASICTTSCDLVTNAGCPSGRSCRDARLSVPASDCRPVGAGVAGTSCTSDFECGADLDCFGSATNGYFCRQKCRYYPDPSACAGSAVCVRWSPQLLVGGVEYGSCL